MHQVERDIRKLGQVIEELKEKFKSFMKGLQVKPPIHESKNVFNSFFFIFSSNNKVKMECSILPNEWTS